MLIGQGGKGFLSLLPCQELLQQRLGGFLTGSPGFLAEFLGEDVGAVSSLGVNQDVAHIHGFQLLGDAAGGVAIGVFLIISIQLLLGGMELVGQLIVVAVGLIVHLHKVDIILQLRSGAQAGMHHGNAGFIAVGLGCLIQLFGGVLQSLALKLRHFKAVQIGLGGHGPVVVPGVQGCFQEILLPGAGLFQHRAHLGIQALVDVQAEIGRIGTILAHEVAHFHPIVHLQLTQGQFMLPGGGDHLIPGGDDSLVLGGVAALAGGVVGVAVGGNRGGLGFNCGLHGFGCLRGNLL